VLEALLESVESIGGIAVDFNYSVELVLYFISLSPWIHEEDSGF
jgi:hypothetical protein